MSEEMFGITKRKNLDDDALIERHELQVLKYKTIGKEGWATTDIEIRDTPGAVTKELAQAVRDEWGVDVTNHGIKVVPNKDKEVKE